jgi:hypothetical protein
LSDAGSTGWPANVTKAALILDGRRNTHSLIACVLLAAEPALRRELVPRLTSGNDFGSAKVVILNGRPSRADVSQSDIKVSSICRAWGLASFIRP